MLDPDELDELRIDAEATLPDTGSVQGRTTTSDGRGGRTVTWAEIGTVICRVARLKDPIEIVNANKVTVVANFRLYVPGSVIMSLSSEKRIIVNGVTYEIVDVDLNQSEPILGVLFVNEVR